MTPSKEEKQSKGELTACKFLIHIHFPRVSALNAAKAVTHGENVPTARSDPHFKSCNTSTFNRQEKQSH